MPKRKTNNTNQIVSPFITGRLYSSATSNNWQDDELNDVDEFLLKPQLSDNTITGLFYVNDPSNQSFSIPNGAGLPPGKGGNFPQLHTQRWGYNELQRRQDDLCKLIKTIV